MDLTVSMRRLSPFSSGPMVNVQFKQGNPLRIHLALLQQYPKLSILLNRYCGLEYQTSTGSSASRGVQATFS